MSAHALALAAMTALAPAPPADDADAHARAAYAEGQYRFCRDPARPLGTRQRALCELAPEIQDCEGLKKACDLEPPNERSWLVRAAEWLAPVAKVLLYVLVAAIVVIVAVPVVLALLRRRRDRRIARAKGEEPNRAQVVEVAPVVLDAVSDAEDALARAEEHRRRGELSEALGLYLAASLAALDRRGALRIARHRTNGEYVRACADEASRTPLREIVREVDRVEFGGAHPDGERVERVAGRARAIVRAITVATLTLLALGCSPARRGTDPAGDELPIEVLTRSGFQTRALGTSLATLPIPEDDAGRAAMPLVLIDVEKVPLEDEASAHLMRWVEAGGVLVLFGHPSGWPGELRSKSASATTRDLVVRLDPTTVTGARTARRDALGWEGAEPVAFLGTETYAARRSIGRGVVLGVANDDLFTNVGMLPPHNAATLVTLLRAVAHGSDVRVAHTEDGVPPPSNPFAALVAAGLGKGAWHALVAAALLFLAYGIRHARPRPVARADRRAFAEHVEATAAVYGRARAFAHALHAYGRFVESRLRELTPHGIDPVALLATRSGEDPERVAKLYARAVDANPDAEAEGDELVVIEELRRLLRKAMIR